MKALLFIVALNCGVPTHYLVVFDDNRYFSVSAEKLKGSDKPYTIINRWREQAKTQGGAYIVNYAAGTCKES